MNSRDPIKIGQIGVCHEHAGAKMTTLRRMPEVFEIVGVVDDRQTQSARFAGGDLTPYEGLRWMSEGELLNTPGLRAVMVETPNADLVPTALRCAEHDLPMHMDKPGGEDLALFRRLLAECRKRRLPFQMGYMFRNNPAMQVCLQAVRDGWLGDIFEVQGTMSHNYGGPAYQTCLGNFSGGIMFNLGCHLIDFIVAMLGKPDKVTPYLKSAGHVAGHVKNNCLAVLEYPRATVTLRACSLEVDGLARRRLKICGTKGTFELCPLERFDGQPLTMSLTVLEGNETYAAGDHTIDLGVKTDRYKDQLLELAKLVRGEMENPWTYVHDDQVQEVVLAAAGYIKLA
ncbi:MAG: Gfo/Idh/MocA family oxidoreductase [Candidatus Pacebacteria bacterium]|nr:Gfo/Idh/MocA family oxidoreductase [Candidatus Paceibacterota bacterium]